MKSRFFLGLMLLFWSVWGNGAVLESLTFTADDSAASVLCKLSTEVKFNTFNLQNPQRAIVDLAETTANIDVAKLKKNVGLIERVRSGRLPNGGLRLVFDVTKEVSINVVKVAENTKGKKLKIELKSRAKSLPTKYKERAPRDVVVIIDPGHGGKDPGAIGARRHAEKMVVLEIAKKLKALVDSEPGMRAQLTRSGDYYVGLRERMDIARKNDADIFVSIHADAFVNKKSNGASVYALSPRGATSEAARWLAEKENYSELGGVDLSDLNDDSGVLRSVLIDLSQTATIRSSIQMGDFVLKSLDNLTNLHHDRVEQARFVVLKSPDIPSILVETGFISNPVEEKNLVSQPYQRRLTQAIFRGIKEYFWQYPPRGTHLEMAVNSKFHYVARGESLASIAAKYNTTVAALKAANRLTSSMIHIGQKLTISEKVA